MLAMMLAGVPALAQTLGLRGSHDRKADLSRLVIVGDSLSAGFQNGSLLDSQQPHGYAALVAAQAGVPLTLPLIAPPGIPNVLELISVGPPPNIIRAPGTSTGRDDIFAQATNLAVPGHNVEDALVTRPGPPIDDLTDLVLGPPGLLAGVARSQLEWAEALHPTTILVWIGNNDALGAALAADPSLVTPIAQFRAEFTELMNRLDATGAALVVANIPDVTVVPALTPTEDIVEETGLPLFVIGPILGIDDRDFVTPQGIALIPGILSNPSSGPLPSSVVLRAAQAAQIRATVNAYDEIIDDDARKHGAALVNIHALLHRILVHGFEANGVRMTNEFLGGIFSLDGVHPTNTGYAIVANAFIRALDRNFDAEIQTVDVEKVAASDPLVFPGIEPPDSLERHVDPDTGKAMQALFAPNRAAAHR
jgi:lysophospholipase L1-like esterase